MDLDIAHGLTDLDGFVDDPIAPDWIVSGAPRARVKLLGSASDDRTRVALWECTAGAFTWHYTLDEAVHLLEGEVVLRGSDGVTQTLRAGDMALFHAGSTVHWTVPDYVKKFAVLHDVRSPLRRFAVGLLGRLRGGSESSGL